MQVSMWHYWFWFTFAFVVNFCYTLWLKSQSYNRADIRGKRASGEKRRVAWPEVFIVIMPLFWASSIIFQAFTYLKILEHNGGYMGISVQIVGYQWGWKYCFSESTYLKLITGPKKVGSKFLWNFGFHTNFINTFEKDMTDKKNLYDLRVYIAKNERNPEYYTNLVESIKSSKYEAKTYPWIDLKEFFFPSYDNNNTNSYSETYFCRQWLTKAGVLQNSRISTFKNQLFQTGLWIGAQGIDPNTPIVTIGSKKILNSTIDPLRLLRSTGSLVLPTRMTLRFMASSEDVTHSWAVPGIGLKIDCVPGRLFYVFNVITREGMYYGQCSELCGWNHYNMPISVCSLPYEHFLIWWELELHNVFSENVELPDYMYIDGQPTVVNYSLINKKYK